MLVDVGGQTFAGGRETLHRSHFFWFGRLCGVDVAEFVVGGLEDDSVFEDLVVEYASFGIVLLAGRRMGDLGDPGISPGDRFS